ncbi:MAG: hypothetical protein JWQ72_962 [Polaromonas sp.]|nr:hypothetical protein [Polaromonas sp.]
MIAETDIRLAAAADAPAIAAMARDHIEQGLPWTWTAERVLRAIGDVDTNVVVAGQRGPVTAFGIMSYPADDAHLLLFAVSEARRRQGLGRALLAWLEAAALSAGAKRIRVEARLDNVAARCFYSEHGYHEYAIKKAMYSGLADGVCLEKWLRPRD